VIKGLDVSRYNDAYKSEAKGCAFLIVKAGEDKRSTNTKYDEQIKFARDGGYVVGTYYWLRPGDPKGQARWYVEKVKPRAGEILTCDFEKQDPSLESRDPTFSEVKEFIAEVKRLAPNNRVGLYVNKDYWETRAKKSLGGADFLWLAWYSSDRDKVENYPGWLWWQYTEGPDYNLAKFDSKAAMLAWAKGDNNVSQPPPAYDPPPLKERISWRRTPGGNPVRACTCMIENITKVVEPRLKAAGVIKNSIDIFQGAYSGSSKSGGTHLGGGAIDTAQYSDTAVKIWRTSGWDYYRRGADYGFDPHGHGVLRGCPHLSAAAEDQHDDYKRGRNALNDHARDPHDEMGQPLITWQDAVAKYAPDKSTVPPVTGGGGGTKYESDIEEFLMTADWDPISTTKPQKLEKLGAWQYLELTDKGNISFAEGPVRIMGYLALIIHGKPGESVYFRTVEDERGTKDEYRRRATYSDHDEVVLTGGSTYAKVPLAYNVGGPRKGWAHNYVRLQWHSSDPNCTITRAEVRVYEGKP